MVLYFNFNHWRNYGLLVLTCIAECLQTQGNVGKWKKKEGDTVAAGDVLCDIETDKATLDLESLEDG